MLFEKKRPDRSKKGRKKKKHVWDEGTDITNPTVGIRAATWDWRTADPFLVSFYDREHR